MAASGTRRILCCTRAGLCSPLKMIDMEITGHWRSPALQKLMFLTRISNPDAQKICLLDPDPHNKSVLDLEGKFF
jgi:hypothetical protein